MRKIEPRSITELEAGVVRNALIRASVSQLPEKVIQNIDLLVVKGECDCGCSSIEFDVPEGNERMLADGVGYLETGERVDIIIWAREDRISSLEIVDHKNAKCLPKPNSICSWEEASRNAF